MYNKCYSQRRCRHKDQTWSRRGKKRAGRLERVELPYVKLIASWNLLDDAGNPKLVLCDNLEGWERREVGWRFKREGICVYLWLVHVDVWQKPSLYFKVIILQLKIK